MEYSKYGVEDSMIYNPTLYTINNSINNNPILSLLFFFFLYSIDYTIQICIIIIPKYYVYSNIYIIFLNMGATFLSKLCFLPQKIKNQRKKRPLQGAKIINKRCPATAHGL